MNSRRASMIWLGARASAVPADQRVTFFAGAKKVTKETPFESERGCAFCPKARASAVPADQRVTFFAGAKKVTKETPFESEPPLRKRCENLRNCEECQVTSSTQECASPANNTQKQQRGSDFCNFLDLHAASTSTSSDFPRHIRTRNRLLSGGSDSKRCFFGDFLCTSKESHPLAAGQRKLLLRLQQETARRRS